MIWKKNQRQKKGNTKHNNQNYHLQKHCNKFQSDNEQNVIERIGNKKTAVKKPTPTNQRN
jgi:hypothetical protein